MSERHGSLSINSDNIFPIIKKWLYSDHDIFFRELISNGCDAITKLKKLDMMGEYTLPEKYKAQVQVLVNPDEKTLKFIDNGLGMTADEVEEYINQIAFSGATDFLAQYKDKTNEDQIIGHFGLGFYSAFMVADEVHIDTLSYKEGAEPVHWECDGGTEYSMETGKRTEVGTEITLFLNEDSLEFANEYRAREVISKYCSFMPVEIFLAKENAPQEYETIDESELTEDDVVVEHIHVDAKTEEIENEDGTKETKEISPAKEQVKINKRPVSLSDPHPLWTKHPNECSDEDYKEFYRKVFMDYKEPLFWIHLNMDYPFNLKGILYFPKINMEYESIEGTIKLYNNQVFIADNIKEVIPEFLMLLPTISEEQSRGNEQRISLSIEYTILFGLLMGIFCMGIFLFFGNELGTVVFHEPLAGSFLCTLAWICPFLYLTGNINSILHGLGKTGITFINQLAAVLVRILALLFFVPRFGIEGVLWSILISQLLLCMSGLLAVSRYIHPTIGLDAYILKPAAAMLLSTGGIYLLKPLSHFMIFRSLSTILILAGNLCLCAILYILLLLSFGIWKLFTSARKFFYLQSQ